MPRPLARPALPLLALALVVAGTGCTAMKNVRSSTFLYLTPAGATLALARPAPEVLAQVEALFADRGFAVTNRATVKEGTQVLWFAGTRERINRRRRSAPDPAQANYVARDIGSWFAVRAVSTPQKTTLLFYGKPTVYGREGCADGDRELRDTGYACTELQLRADWPGHQLVEGREETQVISAVIALLGEQFPEAAP